MDFLINHLWLLVFTIPVWSAIEFLIEEVFQPLGEYIKKRKPKNSEVQRLEKKMEETKQLVAKMLAEHPDHKPKNLSG